MALGAQNELSEAGNYLLLQYCKISIHSAGTNFVQAGNGPWMKPAQKKDTMGIPPHS
jgi:hypothetical protein